MDAHLTAAAAVAHSIARNETTYLALDETISGVKAKVEAALADLGVEGMDDYETLDPGMIRAWGTDADGREWSVQTVDGLTTSVRYV